MNEQTSAMPHLLGINDMMISAIRSGKVSEVSRLGVSQNALPFDQWLEEIMAAGEDQQENKIDGINSVSSESATFNQTLNQLYKALMLAGLRPSLTQESPEANEISEEDWMPEDDDLVSIVGDPDEGSESADASITPVSAMSPQEIVFATGYDNGDLIQKINASTTIEERLGYAIELRDKIIEALRAAGHTAYDIGEADKISINGTIYDVIKASRGLGKKTAVQFMEVHSSAASDDIAAAIFNAVESEMNILPKISASTDPAERQQLATQFRDQLMANLNDSGHTAAAHSSPDKIIVDGVTYDILRNLNAPGYTVYFQAIKV